MAKVTRDGETFDRIIVEDVIAGGGLGVPEHDHIALAYTDGNLTGVTYRSGGPSGTVVATLTLGYTDGNLTSVARS
jgi:hypothetical protein